MAAEAGEARPSRYSSSCRQQQLQSPVGPPQDGSAVGPFTVSGRVAAAVNSSGGGLRAPPKHHPPSRGKPTAAPPSGGLALPAARRREGGQRSGRRERGLPLTRAPVVEAGGKPLFSPQGPQTAAVRRRLEWVWFLQLHLRTASPKDPTAIGEKRKSPFAEKEGTGRVPRFSAGFAAAVGGVLSPAFVRPGRYRRGGGLGRALAFRNRRPPCPKKLSLILAPAERVH